MRTTTKNATATGDSPRADDVRQGWFNFVVSAGAGLLLLLAAAQGGLAASSTADVPAATRSQVVVPRSRVTVCGAWRYENLNELADAYKAAYQAKESLRHQGFTCVKYVAVYDFIGPNNRNRSGTVYLLVFVNS